MVRCKPLSDGPIGEGAMIGNFLSGADDEDVDDNVNHVVCGRGLHSSTSQLNLSR